MKPEEIYGAIEDYWTDDAVTPELPKTEKRFEMQSIRVIIEVTAGIIPGQPMEQYTQKWAITSEEWQVSTDQAFLLAITNGRAQGYAGWLMMQPNSINWVRTDWIWL